MGLLNSLAQRRQLDLLEKQTNQEAMAGVLGSFQQAKQKSLLLDMERKKVDASMAESGFRFDTGTGQYEPDENLIETLSGKPTVSELKGEVLGEYLEGGELGERQQTLLDEVLVGKKKETPIQKEIRTYQKKAADEGWQLNINPQDTSEQQLMAARSLYAAKMRGRGKKPSWGQEQKVEAVRSGLKRGEIVLGKEWGEPSTYKPTTMNEALNAIAEAGLDSSLFTEELKKYEEIMVENKQGERGVVPRYQLEEAIKDGYKEVK